MKSHSGPSISYGVFLKSVQLSVLSFILELYEEDADTHFQYLGRATRVSLILEFEWYPVHDGLRY